MNVIVRFYWQHDLDLVALAMHPDFDMSYWIKQALIAEVRNLPNFRIPLPPGQPYSIDLESNYIHFRLTPNVDDDIISFLNGFRSGFRNSAIKIIFRKYLEQPFLDVFYNEETYRTKSRSHVKKKANKDKAVTAKTPQKRTLVAKPIQRKGQEPETASDMPLVSSDEIPKPNSQKSEVFENHDLAKAAYKSEISEAETKRQPSTLDHNKNASAAKEDPIQSLEEDVMDLSKEEQPQEGDTFDLFGAFEKLL